MTKIQLLKLLENYNDSTEILVRVDGSIFELSLDETSDYNIESENEYFLVAEED